MPSDPAKRFPIAEIPGPDIRRDTQQMPAALRTERLVESLIETVSQLDQKLTAFGSALTTVAQDVSALKAAHEERARKHSGGIAKVSTNDAKQDSAIATLVTDVTALKETQEKQLAILTRLDAVAANPMVRRVAYALGGAVLAYLAAKGYR